jgi:hypothetical protein
MRLTARGIPRSLAPIVEALELDQPVVVTTAELRELVEQAQISTPPHVVVQRLVQRGWLLDTGVRGAWEFIPGSHAGAFPHGDPFLTLRAQLAVRPELSVRVALGSALWHLGVADRAPTPHELSIPSRAHVPAALGRSYRVVRFEPALPPGVANGLPVDRPATVLVHLAGAPNDVRSWGEVLDLLPHLVDLVDLDELARELDGRPHATRARLAYLIDSVAPAFMSAVAAAPGPKVWFGPRRRLRRHDATWNIADTLLPRHPRATDVPS